MITERQGKILKIIIEQYSEKRQPVGSKYIVENNLLNVSSATIRNEMATLEKQGYVKKASSSSGRIPQEKAYDYYNANLVDNNFDLSIFENLASSANTLSSNDVQSAVDLITKLTSHAAIYINDGNESIIDMKIVKLDQTSIIFIVVSSSGEVHNERIILDEGLSCEKLEKVIELIKPEIINIPVNELESYIMVDLAPKLKSYVDNYEVIIKFILQFVKKLLNDNYYLSDSNALIKSSNSIQELQAVYEFLENPLKVISEIEKENDKIVTKINEENNTSIISLRIKDKNNHDGVISVVGPRNMDYKKTTEILNFVKTKMEEDNE